MLTSRPPAEPPVVCISSDMPLTLRFDTALRPESVRMEARERIADVSVGQSSFTLTPPENLAAGERFQVEACFADDAAPACATFVLLAHPALGLSQVKVFRQPRSVASFQEGEKAARAETRQCQEEVHQLRAERGAPEGLRGVLASGLLENVPRAIRRAACSRTGEPRCRSPRHRLPRRKTPRPRTSVSRTR